MNNIHGTEEKSNDQISLDLYDNYTTKLVCFVKCLVTTRTYKRNVRFRSSCSRKLARWYHSCRNCNGPEQ